MRRGPQTQWCFIINTDDDNLEIHDLDEETQNCQIAEIIVAKNAEYLMIRNNTNALQIWLNANPKFDGCKHCLPLYHRK